MIEHRRALGLRAPPLADDLDLETLGRSGQWRRNIAERERALHAVPVSARGHPADDAPLVPYRLIADGVGILRIDAEGDEPQRAAALFFLERGGAADEFALAEIDEASEPRLVRTIDGTVLAGPAAEALLDAQGVQRPAAEEPQSV